MNHTSEKPTSLSVRLRSQTRPQRVGLFSGAEAGASHTAVVHVSIPTGLHHSAQGCEAQATLGQPFQLISNPNGVASVFRSDLLQPFQGCECSESQPRVARASQSWAIGDNPLGIGRTTRRGAASFVLLASFCLIARAEVDVADTNSSPHAAVQTIGLDEIRWTGGFWFDRFENLRTNMLPGMGRLMEGTNYSQYFENFRIAAGLVEGRPRGASFNDGDFYKLLEAASATLAVTNNAFLARHLDRAIEVVAKAQRADGYLHTPVLIRARHGDTNAVPFRDRNNFEMYNMGHLMTAACVHHRVTGRTNFLAVARRAADFLDATMSGASPESARSSVCPSHYMGLVELWRTTREPRYLALARRLFALRSQITDGGDDNQDRIPFEQQSHAMGHAVRANYLYAGAADLFMETGDASLWKPLGPIWTNVVQQKMHITGGCGALYDGASPDGSRDQKSITRTHQAYGRNYQLPNTTAHNETCAAIGSVLWNWRMFLATGEARFVDVMELALCNTVLAGVSLDGTNFFYTNPLRVTDPMPVDLRWSRTRVPFVSSFCCPPNVLRTLAESAGYAYAKSSNSIWVNLYGASTLATKLGGQDIRLTQETEYPCLLYTSPSPRDS